MRQAKGGINVLNKQDFIALAESGGPMLHKGFLNDPVVTWTHSSAVEHYLDMVGVTGSIPVAVTIYFMTVHKGIM